MLQKLKDSIRSCRMPSKDAFEAAVDGAEIVSFDIFDTLIKRNVQRPSDVFELVERGFNKKHDVPFQGFSALRRRAEEAARQKRGGQEEVTLDEIYDEIVASVGADAQELMIEETEIEKCNFFPNAPLIKVFQEAKHRGKRVILVSDTYFPQEFVEDILVANGITGWDRLYVSSVSRKRKRTGDLFDLVLKEEAQEPRSILHVGDSPKEDDLIPKRKGLITLRIPTYSNNLRIGDYRDRQESVDDSYLLSLANNLEREHAAGFFEGIGIEVLGPVLYGFCTWLDRSLKEEGIDRVFFLSRDGHIMKKAFEAMGHAQGRICTYFYASRQAFRTAMLWTLDYEEAIQLVLRGKRMVTLEGLLDDLGLEPSDRQLSAEQTGYKLDEPLSARACLPEGKAWPFVRALENVVMTNSKTQFERLVSYMDQEGMQGRVAIVDIGWHGSMQHYLSEVVRAADVDVSVEGFYLGLREDAPREAHHAYLFSPGRNVNAGSRQRAYLALVEMMFFAQEGSTKSYADDIRSRAILHPYEYAEDERSEAAIRAIQCSALKFIDAMVQADPQKLIEVSPEFCLGRLEVFGLYPSKETIERFRSIMFFDGGADQLIPRSSILSYIAHPKSLYRDLDKSRWKAGFMGDKLPGAFLRKLGLLVLYKKAMRDDK